MTWRAPQGLKPVSFLAVSGTAEAVRVPVHLAMVSIFPVRLYHTLQRFLFTIGEPALQWKAS